MPTITPTIHGTILSTIFGTVGGRESNYFRFNGTDQFAKIPIWTPNGNNWEIRCVATPDAVAGNQHMYGSASLYGAIRSTIYSGSYRDYTDSNNLATGPGTPAIGKEFDWRQLASKNGQQIFIDGSSNSIAPDGFLLTQTQLQDIGSQNGIANFWPGILGNLALIDASPINDTSAVDMNELRYVSVPSVDIGANEDFEISFSAIRQDSPLGTDLVNYFGQLSTAASRFYIWDSLHPSSPNRASMRINNIAINANNACIDIALGQHFKVRYTQTSTGAGTLYIDDVIVGTKSDMNTDAWDISCLGASNSGNQNFSMNDGSALQDFEIINNTQGKRWFWALDEGVGVLAPNSDPGTGPSFDGFWTPDAVWSQYPANVRYYPMNEGEGSVFKNVLDPSGATDATITNPTSPGGGWNA